MDSDATTGDGEEREVERGARMTGPVFGSCWVCQHMRTRSDHGITVGLIRSAKL
jgi:hypothetical protein